MNDFEMAIILEYVKLVNRERVCAKEVRTLPIGYVQNKLIKGHTYYYLQYRVGKKVKSEYIKHDKLKEITYKIDRRRELEYEIGEIRNRKKVIEGLYDKDTLNVMYIKQGVCNVVKEYSEITRIVLFGSRAGSEYRDDSDVDLIFETNSPMSLMKQQEIRLRLEEELQMDVDLIHGPLTGTEYLTVDKEIELYAA